MAVTVFNLPEYLPDLLALLRLDGNALTRVVVLRSCTGVWMNDRVEIIGKLQPLAIDPSVKFGNSQLIQQRLTNPPTLTGH